MRITVPEQSSRISRRLHSCSSHRLTLIHLSHGSLLKNLEHAEEFGVSKDFSCPRKQQCLYFATMCCNPDTL
ncbi:hypothetical protein B9Z55_028175 [Caenorhabditis nigoni]|uniref:Uncharacterized protein n=1 Tax=Caenorhabditis nigoni TaxID=1611254 RepID=A0A2G5SCL6_9PELO|nr:hypothetical protein B9Z55_028175 [Caenorhabditis nigoni]